MEDAVVGLGQVQLRTRCRLAVLPRKESGGSGEDAPLAPLLFRRLGDGIQNRLLASLDEEGGDGDGPGLAGVALGDAHDAPGQ